GRRSTGTAATFRPAATADRTRVRATQARSPSAPLAWVKPAVRSVPAYRPCEVLRCAGLLGGRTTATSQNRRPPPGGTGYRRRGTVASVANPAAQGDLLQPLADENTILLSSK